MILPPGLGPRGASLWRSLTDVYEWDSAEAELLAEACRTLDAIEALRTVVATEGTMSEGSRGQRVVHPAVQELRLQQAAYARLAGLLNLEDASANEGGAMVLTPRQWTAKRGARQRWGDRRAETSA